MYKTNASRVHDRDRIIAVLLGVIVFLGVLLAIVYGGKKQQAYYDSVNHPVYSQNAIAIKANGSELSKDDAYEYVARLETEVDALGGDSGEILNQL